MYQHYIRLDGIFIVKAYSTAFEEPAIGDICIAEDTEERHFNLNLYRVDGLPQYKYINGDIIETTDEDITEQLSRLALEKEIAELEQKLLDGDWIVSRQFSSNTHKMSDDEYGVFIEERDTMRNRIDEIRVSLG